MNEKLILGTVQFGLNYGINNNLGKPSEYEIDRILDTAWERGIRSLDTAEAYGDANSRIGSYHKRRNFSFKIQGKVHNLGINNLRNTVLASLEKLCIDKFSVLSLHSFTDYVNLPECIDNLRLLKEQGFIDRIGISVYTNQELEHLIKDRFIDVVQFPYNILDNENLRGDLIKELKLNGPFNIQFLAESNKIKVIECNARASRSFPFISKVTGINLAEFASKVIIKSIVFACK